MTTVQKKDFIELMYTGTTNGVVFDSNKEADLKEINKEAEAKPLHVIIGEGMVVPGLDRVLEGKEVGKEYTLTLSPQDGFGQRHASLVRPIPLKVFAEKNVNPRPGMSLFLDRSVVQIRAVSGARVIVDFNNPLAGKELTYTFTITKKIDDVAEKTKIFFERFTRHVPEHTVGEHVTLKGPKQVEPLVALLKEKFKELVGKDLVFEEVAPSKKEEVAREEPTQQSL